MLAIENTKLCTVCGKPVGADHYASNPHRHKECHKARMRQVRADRIEYYRDYDRRRFQEDPRRRAHQLASQRKNLDAAKKAESQRKYRAKHSEKAPAVNALNNATRDKRVAKAGHCEICSSTDRIQGHHHDYAKPLDVWWLCDHCHKLLHRLLRAAMRRRA
jgi:hypothetical protein